MTAVQWGFDDTHFFNLALSRFRSRYPEVSHLQFHQLPRGSQSDILASAQALKVISTQGEDDVNFVCRGGQI